MASTAHRRPGQAAGGLAAEEVFLGDRSAGAGGTKGAVPVWSHVVGACLRSLYGFGEGFSDEDELFATLRLYLQARVDKVLAGQFARARKIVVEHRQEVERMAEALITQGSLTGEELRDLVAQQPRFTLNRARHAARNTSMETSFPPLQRALRA